MTQPIIQIAALSKTYGKARPVIDGLDLEVEEGEIVAIRGRSGTGKTTLLNIIGGLDARWEGQVRVAGRSLAGMGDSDLSRLRGETVGHVFQSFNLIEDLDCTDNILLPTHFAPGDRARRAQERLREVLERVGLGDQARDMATTLSGGQKQRVAIARAVIMEPRVLLCDEPTGNLDEETGRQILDLFADINARDGVTIVLVTHEGRVADIAGRVVTLEGGTLV